MKKKYAHIEKQVEKFLEGCIDTINHVGLYEEPKNNFLQNIENGTIWGIIAFAIPGLLAGGMYLENQRIDRQKFNLEQEILHLKYTNDSLTKFIQFTSSDSTTYKKATHKETENR